MSCFASASQVYEQPPTWRTRLAATSQAIPSRFFYAVRGSTSGWLSRGGDRGNRRKDVQAIARRYLCAGGPRVRGCGPRPRRGFGIPRGADRDLPRKTAADAHAAAGAQTAVGGLSRSGVALRLEPGDTDLAGRSR